MVRVSEEDALLEKRVTAARRLLAIRQARDELPKFIHLMMPDVLDPSDPLKSEYQQAPHAKLLCDIIAQVERGDRKRVAVSIPPQHGKTIHLSTYGPAWILGRNPRARIVIATYNETRADELGEDFRKVITSHTYQTIFPDVDLETGSKSKSAMTTTKGGKIFFVGTGGTVTGRTAEVFIIDDPMKDDEELQSDTFREKMWKWFYSVAYSRGSKRTRMIVLHTRWHADDLIGRLCDPAHTERHKRFKGIADDWTYLNISGVVQNQDLADTLGLKLKKQTDKRVLEAFGDEPMCALWEADKDLAHFAQWKIAEPRTFSALVMGKPSVEDGEFFRKDWLIEYGPEDLPDNLQFYGASDHAVSEKQGRDYTVIGCVGIDEHDNIWVMPDLVWKQIGPDVAVEEMLLQFKLHRPNLWWMESELITKSFGPFLHKRMIEERIYTTIDAVIPGKDKQTRARAIQARMSMGKLRFPRHAPWWAGSGKHSSARSELLQFPYGAHDDFVDWLSHIGMGLMKEMRPSKVSDNDNRPVVVGSPQWILRQSKLNGMRQRAVNDRGGW